MLQLFFLNIFLFMKIIKVAAVKTCWELHETTDLLL